MDHNDQDRWIGGAEKGQMSNWTKSTKRDRGGGTEAGGASWTKYAKLTKRDRGGGGGSKCQAVAKDRAICQLVVRGNPGYWRNWG